ncbi:MAG TPA: beta-propeller domain-containing protein, partial [Euzebyales bacterium]
MGRSPRNATLRRFAGALLALALGATACTPPSTDDTDGAAGGSSGDAITLARFASCDAFAAEVQRRALVDVSPYGLESPAFATGATDAVALEAGDAGAAPTAGQDFSGTNVQEEGVDEPDVVKTDGRFVYSVADGVLRIVDVRGARPEVAAILRASDGVPRELLLHGTRLLLLGDDAKAPPPPPGADPQLSEPADVGVLPLPPLAVRTRMWAVDVGAPSDPRITSTMAVDGTLVTSRAVDGTARIVLRSTPLPEALVMPGGGAPDAERAVAINRQRIRDAAAAEWLPHATVDDAPPEPLVTCTAVHRSSQGAGTGIVSVLSVELDRPELATDRVDAVLGAAETVYADRDSLYVTTSRWPQILPVEPLPVEPLPVEPVPVEPVPVEPVPVEPVPVEPVPGEPV